MDPLNLGVLASHNGTNLQAIIDACEQGQLNAHIRVVISNNSRSLALQRARNHHIPALHLSSHTHPDADDLDLAIADALSDHDVDLVVLAGYMKLLGPRTLARYRDCIVNIHPALLPEFGGRGMYGDRVHRAVLVAGRRTTGVTVHLVDEFYDSGKIIDRAEVDVDRNDTVETLRARVQNVEHSFYVNTLKKLIANGVQCGLKLRHRPKSTIEHGIGYHTTINLGSSNVDNPSSSNGNATKRPRNRIRPSGIQIKLKK